MTLTSLTIHELHQKIKNGETTSRQLTESVFQRIEKIDPKIRAYATLTRDVAMAQAEAGDQRIRSGQAVAPLTGIPLALKDNLCTRSVRTTCSSKILENFVPPYDATVVEKFKNNGFVMAGKTNMDEFAMGSSTENSAFAVTKNPWSTDRIPGGSSGGSAAAVAADLCIAAVGSDTGGSIRQPAACCGVVGFKPTYGRVSRYGLVAFASSLDQIGPLTKDVTDSALMMNAISGHDPMDSTSADIACPDFTRALVKDVKGLRLGMPKEYFIEGMDPEVERAVKESVRLLEKAGAVIKNIRLPHTSYAVATYYLLATAEASSNLARYDGVKYGYRTKQAKNLLDMYMKTRSEGFGQEVKRRIMLGTYALSAGYYDAYYRKAQQVRTLIKDDFDVAWKEVDAILTPTAPTPAFLMGEKTQDPLQMYLSDIFTISVNLAGIPAISIPCGFTKSNLPIGLQILGRPFDEETVLRVAYAYEQETDWHKRKPNL